MQRGRKKRKQTDDGNKTLVIKTVRVYTGLLYHGRDDLIPPSAIKDEVVKDCLTIERE